MTLFGLVVMVLAIWSVFTWLVTETEYGWMLTVALFIAGFCLVITDSEKRLRANDRWCSDAGGYMERGTNIKLCIDEQTGTIIRKPVEVER